MRIVLVDDHTLFRMGVRHVLTNTARPSRSSAKPAPPAARSGSSTPLTPDLVLMDIAMPGMDGVLATREIGRRAPKARVLIVSAHDQVNDVLDALEAGAAGLRAQERRPETLIEAIRVGQPRPALRRGGAGAAPGGVRGTPAPRQRRARDPVARASARCSGWRPSA